MKKFEEEVYLREEDLGRDHIRSELIMKSNGTGGWGRKGKSGHRKREIQVVPEEIPQKRSAKERVNRGSELNLKCLAVEGKNKRHIHPKILNRV